MSPAADAPFHEQFLILGEDGGWALRGGYSEASGQHHFPLSERCPFSGSDDVVEVRLPNTGKLDYWTVVRTAPPGYSGPVPYGLGVVTLDGIGLRILTRLALASEAGGQADAEVHLDIEQLPGPDGAPLTLWQFVLTEPAK